MTANSRLQVGRRLTAEEVRAVQLRTLDCLTDVCEELDVSFSLAYGSLLGAVRHGGFIPWDDDIDVMIARTDYDRLILNADLFLARGFKLGDLTLDPRWPLPFGKLWCLSTVVIEKSDLPLETGVGLDLFPVDFVATRGVRGIAHGTAAKFFQGLHALMSVSHSPRRTKAKKLALRLAKPLLRPMGPRRLAAIWDRFARASLWEQAGYRGVAVGSYPWGVAERSLLFDRRMSFEERQLPVPRDAERVLAVLYGDDYEQLPPPHERVTHHAQAAYWVGMGP